MCVMWETGHVCDVGAMTCVCLRRAIDMTLAHGKP